MSPRKRTCPTGATVALFVEGGDDERMVRALLTEDVFIQVIQGTTTDLVENIVRATMKDPGWPNIKTIGVVVDAGESHLQAKAVAKTVFEALNIHSPSGVATLERRDGITIGFFVVPDDDTLGGSDTLLLRTAKPEVQACVEAYFSCMGEPAGTQEQRDKARSWAMAAALGPKRAHEMWASIDPSHPALAPLRSFLSALVSPN